jgi:release factor glutamine methyltransferase
MLLTVLDEISARLEGLSDTPRLDAQVLLAHLLSVSRAWVLAHPEVMLTPEHEKQLIAALARLESGQPLPYVLGEWEFYGLTFELTPGVLIPRPETELLVQQALEWLAQRPAPLLAADVGTGSGCIAISLAVHAPQLRLLASDLSWPALQVARSNLARHRVEGQISLLQCDLLPPLSVPFDLLVANLPYIPSSVLPGLRVSLSEPPLALDGGLDGLDILRRLLLAAAPGQLPGLAPGGLLLLEIEASQGQAALSLAHQSFPGAEIRLLPDLAGRDRVLYIQR